MSRRRRLNSERTQGDAGPEERGLLVIHRSGADRGPDVADSGAGPPPTIGRWPGQPPRRAPGRSSAV